MVERFGNFKADGHDTKKEIQNLVKLIQTGKLKKEDLENSTKLKSYINKDKRIANEIYLSDKADKALMQTMVDEFVQSHQEIIKDLKKYKLLDANNKLKQPWSGPRGVKFLQVMLNHLSNANLKVDGAFWPNTFWALVQYQKQSDIYKATTLQDTQSFANSKNLGVTFRWNMNKAGVPDGIADGRTLYSMLKILHKKKQSHQEEQSHQEGQADILKQIFVPVGYLKDGHYYILWKNGKEKLVTYDSLSPEVKEKLEKFKEIKEKVELLNFLFEAVKKAGWKISDDRFKQWRKDISELIQDLMNKKIELQDANKKIVEIFTSVLGNGATTYDLKQAFEKEKK